jgi:DnaJ-class molecular chaperone
MFSPPPQTHISNKTYYEILEIEKEASEDEIKKAYRRLSLKYHPDRNHSPDATETIKNINTAYETLKDKETRRLYDHHLNGGGGGMEFPGFGGMGGGPYQSGGGGGPMFFHTNFGNGGEHVDFANIGNIFESVFGGGNGINPNFFHQHIHQQLNKSIPIVTNIDITFTQSYTGCVVPIEINKIILLNGEQIKNPETIYVTIPEGIDNNEIIIIREKGNETINGTKGDVKVFINIKKDLSNVAEMNFERKGLDLILKKNISLKEALCGFSFNIKHINGSNYCIKNNNSIVCPNQKQVVPKLGMKRDGNIGNLIVEYTVEFPTSLDDSIKESLKIVLPD